MANVPEEMKRNGRPVDDRFTGEEKLYRRFHPDACEGHEISIDAIELPDMSVNREKYGSPKWLLLNEDFESWGVLGFEVGHIPREIEQDGVTKYTFGPKHRPLRNNYPHSEVWAYRDGEHIDAKNSDLLLDPAAHQRWRQKLAWKCRIVIRPSE